jgi:hypothetical protein
MIVLHFGKFWHRDDRHIPNDNQLKKLKEILAKDGFTEEPGWFTFIQ